MGTHCMAVFLDEEGPVVYLEDESHVINERGYVEEGEAGFEEAGRVGDGVELIAEASSDEYVPEEPKSPPPPLPPPPPPSREVPPAAPPVAAPVAAVAPSQMQVETAPLAAPPEPLGEVDAWVGTGGFDVTSNSESLVDDVCSEEASIFRDLEER